mmetsp:Transcript_10906/g.19416  ORF Transcript_10906/g.19416 Transcript_10906/m.19416 type:complete len:83 (-) Transcript_10906:1168-1416(-)
MVPRVGARTARMLQLNTQYVLHDEKLSCLCQRALHVHLPKASTPTILLQRKFTASPFGQYEGICSQDYQSPLSYDSAIVSDV